MDVDKCRIVPNKKGFIEVLNVKLSPDEVSEIIKTPNIYPAYHMNKKHWITIILDNSLSDEKILSLIDKSHKFTEKSVKPSNKNVSSYAR